MLINVVKELKADVDTKETTIKPNRWKLNCCKQMAAGNAKLKRSAGCSATMLQYCVQKSRHYRQSICSIVGWRRS